MGSTDDSEDAKHSFIVLVSQWVRGRPKKGAEMDTSKTMRLSYVGVSGGDTIITLI